MTSSANSEIFSEAVEAVAALVVSVGAEVVAEHASTKVLTFEFGLSSTWKK